MTTGAGLTPTQWKAVWQLADAWSETSIVQQVAAELPRNQGLSERLGRARGIPALLEYFESAVGGLVGNPLQYGSRYPALEAAPELVGFGRPQVDESDWTRWIEQTQRLESAHQNTLGWFRASLSGYPLLRAPQLAPGTPYTTHELTSDFIWSREELASGLVTMPAPPDVAELLGADRQSARRIDEACRELVAQLNQSDTWVHFDQASAALDHRAKKELHAARKELTARLTDDQLAKHEAELAVPRAEYRAHVTHDVIQSLTGAARLYADAFSAAHSLLSLAACDIFGQLVMYGEPWSVPITDLATPRPGEAIVEFTTPGAIDVILACGQIIWPSDSSIADAVRIESKTLSFEQTNESYCLFEAQVLLGTAAAWPAPRT